MDAEEEAHIPVKKKENSAYPYVRSDTQQKTLKHSNLCFPSTGKTIKAHQNVHQ